MDIEEVVANRSADLSKRAKIREKLGDVYKAAEEAFRDQTRRSSDIDEYWDIYSCVLGGNQAYHGDNSLYVPSVLNAIEARVTRFANQIFPTSGRHVECISTDSSSPRAITSLVEHYIRKSQLRLLIPSLLVCGDIEGHYWLYTYWNNSSRHIVRKTMMPVISPEIGPVGMVPDIVEETLQASYPATEIISDCDVAVVPATSGSLADALDQGGSVTIVRRWNEVKIQRLIDAKMIDAGEGKKLIKDMSKDASQAWVVDRERKATFGAGIQGTGRGKHALVYETWTKLDVDGDEVLLQCFFAGRDRILHAHRNPLWCDRLPLIGHPARRQHGSHKGRSLVSAVDDLQYFVNDMANEAADSSNRAMCPIVMTDPVLSPRYDSMITAMNAVWKCNPNGTRVLEFPQLWKDAGGIIQQLEAMIMQTMSVNPAMITQAYRRGKPTQAEQMQEHAIDLLTTANAVTAIEEGILTPWVQLAVEMDHQFRDEAITVQQYGEMGVAAKLESIDPLQMDGRYVFRWDGVEQVRNAQQIQQQIAAINVVRGIPPQLYPGYVLNLVPVLLPFFESTFGPQRGRLVFQDLKELAKTDPAAAQALAQQQQAQQVLGMMAAAKGGANKGGRQRSGGMPQPGSQPKPGGGMKGPPGAIRKPAGNGISGGMV
jgi:hypothetical protein